MRWKTTLGLIGGVVLGWLTLAPLHAQGPFPAQIQAAIRALLAGDQTVTGTWTFAVPPVGTNPFDQDLNTTDAVAFEGVTVAPLVDVNSELAVESTGTGTSALRLRTSGGVNAVNFVLTDGGGTSLSAPSNLGIDAAGNISLTPSSISHIIFSNNTQYENGAAIRSAREDAATFLHQAFDVNLDDYLTFITITNSNTPTFALAPSGDGTVAITTTTHDFGAAGFRATGSDGVATLLGLGNGNDENLTIDFDNAAANEVNVSTSTDVSVIDFTTLTLEAAYNSSDGTAGLTQTCAAAVVAVTVKNGLITAITCP